MENEIIGTCLCGQTVVHVKHPGNEVVACHCGMCRKQAAGPIFYTGVATAEEYRFEEGSPVKVYRSSDFAERGFCSECGTFLFWRNKEHQNTGFNAELFPDIVEHAQFDLEIYTKDKPGYYAFANETEKK